MLTIRLQRTGKKNQADFRIVLAEKESPVQKKFVEILGSYNPRKKNFKVFEERVKYWIGQNIEMSETVNNLFITKGFLNTKKVKAFTIPKKPVEAVKEEAKPATSTAAADPSAEASVKVETPAEVKEATVEMEAKIEQAEIAPQDKAVEPVAEAPKDETPVA